MFPFSNLFLVIGEPRFGDPTRTRPNFGKDIEALAAKQGLNFGNTGLYPPSAFPGYNHPHFEYCLFTGPTASSEFTSIDFDYHPRFHKLLVQSELPEAQVLPLVKFIAKHYLHVTIRTASRTSELIRLTHESNAPAAKQFCVACQKLAALIRESCEIPDLHVERQPLVRKHLTQMSHCTQEFNHDDVERMAHDAHVLYKYLHTWITQCHPKQLDPTERNHDSFAGLVLDLMENLNSLKDWTAALFVRQKDAPRWRYNPELFAKLLSACEKAAAKPQTIGEVPIDEFWSRFNKEKNKAKIGAPSADDHAANSYTQAEIAKMFGPPCNEEMVANWEAKARGGNRGSVPPAAMYKGRIEGYREELRKYPIRENVDILSAIITQYKATEGVRAITGKKEEIHCRSAESLYQAQKKHGA